MHFFVNQIKSYQKVATLAEPLAVQIRIVEQKICTRYVSAVLRKLQTREFM